MIGFYELANSFGEMMPLILSIAAILATYLAFSLLLSIAKKSLLRLARTKRQISNVEIFSTAVKYVFLVILALSILFYYSGSWTGLGLTLGLFSAAIGFALQKPISGIAAWIMVVTRRPFEIGDRISIGEYKGDVRDISLMHITLKEIGGIVPSEENSGRMILVPNSLLFEQNIINYTQQDEFILDQVMVSITYESNLEKAVEICKRAAKKETKQFYDHVKKEPYVRNYFQASGINLYVRFFVPAKRMQEFSSNITTGIYKAFKKTKEVQFAYPHTEVIIKK